MDTGRRIDRITKVKQKEKLQCQGMMEPLDKTRDRLVQLDKEQAEVVDAVLAAAERGGAHRTDFAKDLPEVEGREFVVGGVWGEF